MSEPLLTAAMIVRNEASHLHACLESIRDLVDEIVIVDTGSSDESVSIARSFGARIHVHPWRGSFDAPRNTALELARGKWILYIDADERLRPCSPQLARARIAQASEVALRVRLSAAVGTTPYWEYRLWRSDPRIRFAGVIHEKMTTAIAEVAAADGLTVGECGLFLEHVGYAGDQTHKHERNLPMLRAQLAIDPADTYNWHHLATVLDALGEEEQSEVALEQAVEAARKNPTSPGMQAFFRLICHRRQQGQDTTELLEEGLTRYPDNIGLIWLKVIAEIEAKRYEQALRRLELFDVDIDMPVEDIVGYRAELFGARAAEARGMCLFKLDRYSEAAAAYERAQQLEPDEPGHRLKHALAEARATRSQGRALAPNSPASSHRFRWAARELLNGFGIDLGGVPVELRASDAMRAAAMHALLGRMSPATGDPVAQLVFSRHRMSPPQRRPDDSVGELHLWNDNETFSIAFGDCVGGRVEADRATLGGHTRDLSRMFRYVAPFMLASLLAPHGRFILHAGAIRRDRHAVLVLGGTGTGKSTLIVAALRDGWKVLADDLVTLSSELRGPSVSGIPRPLVVPAEILGGEAVRSVDDTRARAELDFEAWERTPHPIAAIVVVGHGQTPETVLEPVERSELLRILVHSMLSQQARDVRRYISLAAVLSDLPAWRLLHTRTSESRMRLGSEALRRVLAQVEPLSMAGVCDV